MRIAFVGCGFVADYYWNTARYYPDLKIMGVYDINQETRERFCKHYGARAYPSLEALLHDPHVDMVINLTNPRSHFEISKAALLAGKHVYSEKPMGMTMEEASQLVELARSRGLRIASAPCNLLSETAQTVWHALKSQKIGRPRLVYAEMDDGLVHKMPYREWRSRSGSPWPYKDEFEVGCTLEHAGYYVTWLTAFFGPAHSITAFASCLVEDKETDTPLDPPVSPDFSVALIRFASGMVARLTCGIVAPHNHSLTVIGDEGNLHVDDCWFYRSPVYIRRRLRIRRRSFMSPFKEKCLLPKIHEKSSFFRQGAQQMDFARGIKDTALAIETGQSPRLSEDFSLHNTEIYLAIHRATETGSTTIMKTTFEPPEPMKWAPH